MSLLPSGECCSFIKLFKFVSPLNFSPDLPETAPKCTWEPSADPSQSPHTKSEWKKNFKVYPNVLETIGNTPVVKLNSLPKEYGLKCEVLVKCEFFNPGGSIKDRIAYRMIEDAETMGLLKPGYTIIEPSSGNTGIGLALCAAVKGYRCIIVMSEKMSNEKADVLNALGAEVVRTPITAASNAPDGLFAVCHKLKSDIPNSIILDQYSNPSNPLAHYDATAEEILDSCEGFVDMIVIGTGTGGTITGIGKKIKEKSPTTLIVAADPEGSILAGQEEIEIHHGFYEVEGIGYDFIPTAMNRDVVDKWIKVNDEQSFPMARQLISKEGILCGGSSGAVMAAAIEAAKDLEEDQRVLIILPDSVRNYLTKFISDPWMEARHLTEAVNTNNHSWWDTPLTEVTFTNLPIVNINDNLKTVYDLMINEGAGQVGIVDDGGILKSVITEQKLMTSLTSKFATISDTVTRIGMNIFPKIDQESNLGLASRILSRENYVVVVMRILVDDSGIYEERALGVLTHKDLLALITS